MEGPDLVSFVAEKSAELTNSPAGFYVAIVRGRFQLLQKHRQPKPGA